MTDLSQPLRQQTRTRVVTAAALFDGHDAAINIVRRLLQARGAEVIHLGHNRSVAEIVRAAVQEDAQAIAVSSYQGGHLEFFRYLLERLRDEGAGHVRVFGGGGGVIVPEEIEALHQAGVTRVYSPEDGLRLGLAGMVEDMLGRCTVPDPVVPDLDEVQTGNPAGLARLITALECGVLPAEQVARLHEQASMRVVPVLGITGTGGSGKSSLADELVRRLRINLADRLKIALIAVDPSRRRTGGALLGDRIRMNAIDGPHLYMRSLATRDAEGELSAAVPGAVAACKLAGFDLVMVETSGIGQGDAAIVPIADLCLYVMTPEFGAATQLEKIDMLDFADFVAINKFDRRGAEDALRDVRKQYLRNHVHLGGRPGVSPENIPVYGTQAARFNDPGVTALYYALLPRLAAKGLRVRLRGENGSPVIPMPSPAVATVVPPARSGYLAEIAATVRAYRRRAEEQARAAREIQQLQAARDMAGEAGSPLDPLIAEKSSRLDPDSQCLLNQWPQTAAAYAGDEYAFRVRGKERRVSLRHLSLSGTPVPRVALPRFEDRGELLRWLMLENLPGAYPFTAGVFPFKHDEEPTRMFAGEGDPQRTNRRFHALSAGMPARRLSTAFDSVTLYGCDPDERPDIYGKIGNAGVSVATLDDMMALYDGFDLTDPATSVSMTINGPAPILLAMFFNAAIDQQRERFERDTGRPPTAEEDAALAARVLASVRGTVQADILKEDQGQNTCIFSIDFALRMMADMQEYFIAHHVRNFYSVSISGYHIAEAGANPISQLAFTLANGFTYVEAWLARGMAIDDFAPNLSFFFSNGMEPEYAVIGRVARRIWAVALKEKYGAGERAQKLKYHIQTSGRSLHAREMTFNDIRTTLQALIATYDHCNSLHTNAFDEAVTTPTEDSVRRALAIQLIINREWGLAKNENPNQGSFVIEALTDLVEEAVLKEFDSLSRRGGVLGAMEAGYQRGRIQEESLLYEQRKHGGSLPVVGVNVFTQAEPGLAGGLALARSTEAEKQGQLRRLRNFQARHRDTAPEWLSRVKQTALAGANTFEVLMSAVRHCSLGQLTQALYEAGGQYRRNM